MRYPPKGNWRALRLQPYPTPEGQRLRRGGMETGDLSMADWASTAISVHYQHVLEAWITSERIPIWMQFQISVAQRARNFERGSELVDGQILFVAPGVNEGQIFHQLRSIDGIFVCR